MNEALDEYGAIFSSARDFATQFSAELLREQHQVASSRTTKSALVKSIEGMTAVTMHLGDSCLLAALRFNLQIAFTRNPPFVLGSR